MTRFTDESVMPIQMFARQVSEDPDSIYLRQPVDGEYHEYSWAQVYDQTLRLAAGFLNLGLKRGDRVAILADNCADWFIADFAIMAAGLISVPIYSTAGKPIISHVLEHSAAKAIIVGRLGKTEPILEVLTDNVISIGMSLSSIDCQHEMAEIIASNEPLKDVFEPDRDDIFSIVYTSGSTGLPKGVVSTYKNIVFAAVANVKLIETDLRQRLLSYLPLAHVTERALVEYSSLYGGATVTFNESLQTFINDLRSAQVTSFISVPRLWVKFQSNVLASLPQRKLDFLLKIPVVGNAVKIKIKNQLGLGTAQICGSGSAPISPSILDWYAKLGIEISEGWGMTETAGMATSQYPYRPDKRGTIGKAIDGLEVRLSDQGEILVRGDAVFKEYYRNPEATAETFTDDGFMRTGDKAEIDADGYFRITGRVKELFKSGKGKYVAPVPIESKLASNQLIEQLCVMGSGLPKAVAVIVLSKEVASDMSREEIAVSLSETLEQVNQQIEKHEVVGSIRVTNDEWTIDNGLLTPTLKIKRTELEEKYRDWICEDCSETVVWE